MQGIDLNIICMKWGAKFPPDYVNRLYGMVARNTTREFRFVCFTEHAEGVREEVEIQPLPKLDLPEGIPERGWKKLSVFEENFGGLEGPTIFLDLDVVIVGNIDCFFDHPGEFLMCHDKKNANNVEGNSSVFRYNIGAHVDILDYFTKNFEQVRSEVRHEQAYLSRELHKQGKMNYWPDAWVPSFKYRCIPPFPQQLWQTPEIPVDARIVLFHGLPNPDDAADGKSGKWYRFIKPTPWIEEHWRA